MSIKMNLWMLAAILTTCSLISMTMSSCSALDNPVEAGTVNPDVPELTPQEEIIKAYINAANMRESVSDEERAKTYAPYEEWRADAPDSDEPLFNLRFTTNEFDFESENVKELPNQGYVPSRDGLDELSLSGSGRPNKKQLEALAKTLKEKAGDQPIWFVDLRAEMHGLINGHHLSQYGFQNWGTIGMTRDQILQEEETLVHSLKGKKITYAKIGSATQYQPTNPKEEEVTEALTMKEAVEALGMHYYRITALDHVFQTDATLDSFFEFYRTVLPSDAWVHFHCQAGRGRTTFFMALVDMIENPNVSMDDIFTRQVLIGGTSLYNDGELQTGNQAWRHDLFEEISVMVPVLYEYVQENHGDFFEKKWSEWKREKYGYLMQ